MIIQKRKTHFYSFIILAFILPIIFFIGVLFPPEYPLTNNLNINDLPTNNQVSVTQNQDLKPVGNSQILSDNNIKLEARTFLENDSLILELKPLSHIEIIEALIYWQKTPEKSENITDESILLGQLAGKNIKKFQLPEEAKQNEGTLILYSQGFKEIQAIFPVNLTVINK